MAQESRKMETEEASCRTPAVPILCANNCGFFGDSATLNLCSLCYRDVVAKEAVAAKAITMAMVETVDAGTSRELGNRNACLEQFVEDNADPNETDCSEALGVPEPAQKPVDRCFSCSKRVGLRGFKCRCGKLFCVRHRYSDKHGCSYDYRSAAREAIAKANPVIRSEKVDKI